tara:strand:+ start:64 stop:261 length:198 start_codon:yes stop_codon:yes gene_type:complete
MTFDNREYLNNELKKARAVLRGLVADTVANDGDLKSAMIVRQEETVIRFADAVNKIDEERKYGGE